MIQVPLSVEVEVTAWLEPGPHLSMDEAEKKLHKQGTRILERDDANRRFLVLKENA